MSAQSQDNDLSVLLNTLLEPLRKQGDERLLVNYIDRLGEFITDNRHDPGYWRAAAQLANALVAYDQKMASNANRRLARLDLLREIQSAVVRRAEETRVKKADLPKVSALLLELAIEIGELQVAREQATASAPGLGVNAAAPQAPPANQSPSPDSGHGSSSSPSLVAAKKLLSVESANLTLPTNILAASRLVTNYRRQFHSMTASLRRLEQKWSAAPSVPSAERSAQTPSHGFTADS